MEAHQNQFVSVPSPLAGCLRSRRVLLVGLGNIGSFLATLLAPLVAFMRLVDRDVVELHNTVNQCYAPEHEGQTKVAVTAARIKRLSPALQIERCVRDVEDLTWAEFADVDVALAGLDSLRPRQVLSEKLYPLQIPYLDGAVGAPLLVRVQVLLPGEACLECSWGAAQYRQLATEFPCNPGGSDAPRTTAPGCAGAATASVMVAQAMRLFGDHPPQGSYEINGDLSAARFVASRRRRNARCRYEHEHEPQVVLVERPFAVATIADLVSEVRRACGLQGAQLEFRRGILAGDLFGPSRFVLPEQLHRIRHRRLAECGLTPMDRVVVRASGQPGATHLCFNSSRRSVSCP